jgi:hypothetical protein
MKEKRESISVKRCMSYIFIIEVYDDNITEASIYREAMEETLTLIR